MGVYIKGMRMPRGCYDPLVAPPYCFLLRSGTCEICHEYADKHGELCMEYPQGCPLVEVDEPQTETSTNSEKVQLTDEPQTKQQTKRPWGMYIIEHPMYK